MSEADEVVEAMRAEDHSLYRGEDSVNPGLGHYRRMLRAALGAAEPKPIRSIGSPESAAKVLENLYRAALMPTQEER